MWWSIIDGSENPYRFDTNNDDGEFLTPALAKTNE